MSVRLRLRFDQVNDRHATLTIFQSGDGYNWANAGQITVDEEWADRVLDAAEEGTQIEVSVHPIAIVREGEETL